MPKERHQHDPAATFVRNAAAARRIGERRCSCGETRPWALVPKSEPLRCYECLKKGKGVPPVEHHHLAGKANNSTTVGIPANDHRAELTSAQYDWPKKTLENPEGSPLLARAASIRGFVDTSDYFARKLQLFDPEFYEVLDDFLTEKFGPKWWNNTGLERFAPDR